ncbi:acetate--CoA ligase family protein [Microbacterium soli]|uniref:Acetate--CoA ligase family protein n=1 Tax=Microbacterium soli TaxID=446075 RepID=A0ABP7N0U0_9MICO
MHENPKNMRALMTPSSVAVVGASERGMGGRLLDQLLDWGFSGPVYPVNPRYQNLRGLTCYPSLAQLPMAPELVAVVVAARHVNDVLAQAGERGAKAAIIPASGFGEVGGEGEALERQIIETANQYGLTINGPNNYGVASLHDQTVLSVGPIPSGLRPGNIALLFASGALTNSVDEPVYFRGLGISHIITVGNEAQVGIADYMNYLIDDPHVTVIACFVEGFRDPRSFEAAARRAAAAGKRLVVLKTGRSESARRAALAHTGALVGADSAIDAWLRKLGVARVRDLDELIETAILLARYPDLGYGNVGIASVSGGGSGVLADLAADTGLEMAPFSDDTTARLREVLPAYATPNNPLDVTTFGLGEESRHNILRTLCDDDEVEIVTWAFHTPGVSVDDSRETYAGMIESLGTASDRGTRKPAAAFTMVGGAFDPAFVEVAAAHDIPLLSGARSSLAAIAAAQQSTRRLRWLSEDSSATDEASPPRLVDDFRALGEAVVPERTMKQFLSRVGVPVTREILARDVDEAVSAFETLGVERVALKVESSDIAHKAAAGGVLLGVEDVDAVRAGFHRILSSVEKAHPTATIEGVLVQEMADDGIDVFVGCTIEPGIGPVLALGAGGVLVEAIDSVSTALCPMGEEEARALVEESAVARVIRGVGGDLEALADAVRGVSQLAHWLRDEFEEMDVNPIRVFGAGAGVRALDALAARRTSSASSISHPTEGAEKPCTQF